MVAPLDSPSLLNRLPQTPYASVPFAPETRNHADTTQGAVHEVGPAKKTCPNCGRVVTETYCPTCGQKYERERFTLPSVLSTILKEVIDLERGGLATVVGLSRSPGRVVRDYWARRTKPYLNPAKYFLFALTVFQLALWQTGVASNLVEGFLEGFEAESVSQAQALQLLDSYFVLFFAAGLPFLVLASYWGTERTLAEHAIFQLYVAGHLALLWSVLLLVKIPLSITDPIVELISGLALFTFSTAYYVWAYVAAHRPDTEHSAVRKSFQGLATLLLFSILYGCFLILSIGLYENVL